jgi:hypothetical protein
VLLGHERSFSTLAETDDGLVSFDAVVLLEEGAIHVCKHSYGDVEVLRLGKLPDFLGVSTGLDFLRCTDVDHQGVLWAIVGVEGLKKVAGVAVSDHVVELLCGELEFFV